MNRTDPKDITILVADDDPLICSATEAVLRRLGYDVVTARDGDLALKRFEEASRAIQLVVSDMNMPGLPGPQLISALRRISPSIAALLISGTSPPVSLGALPVLFKPFSLDGFAAKVGELLGAIDLREIEREQSSGRSRKSGL